MRTSDSIEAIPGTTRRANVKLLEEAPLVLFEQTLIISPFKAKLRYARKAGRKPSIASIV